MRSVVALSALVVVVVVVAVVAAPPAIAAEPPSAASPASRVVKGFDLAVESVERRATWTLQRKGKNGKPKQPWIMTPPAGKEVVLVRLSARATSPGIVAELGASSVVDARGARHACALTKMSLPLEGDAVELPCNVPIGAVVATLELEGESWTLPPEKVAP